MSENILQPILRNYHYFHTKPYAEEILSKVKKRMDAWDRPGKHKEAMKVIRIYTEYVEQKGLTARMSYLDSLAIKENQKFRKQLDAFNAKNNISMGLAGLKINPIEFVFINTWANPKDKRMLPIRLALKPEEIKTNFEQHLQTKLEEEYAKNEKQIAIWQKRGFDFDFPRAGQTSFMIAAVPDTLLGIESDTARIAQIFSQEFGAHWQSVSVEDIQEWKRWQAKAPENTPPTKENLLAQFDTGLKRAIDSGQQHFSFYYLMHGHENGTMSAEDISFSAAEFTKILAKNYKGKPIAAQIEVSLIAESCYSGSQLDTIIADLQTRKIPVKSLRVITAAARETVASIFTSDTASLLSDSEMMRDSSGAMSYYLSYYFELMNSMRKEGRKIEAPLGTIGHALAFVDRMAKEDVSSKQNLQAYYYSTMDAELTEPEPTKTTDDKKPVEPPKIKERKFGESNEAASTPSKKPENTRPSGYYFSKKEVLNRDKRIV